MSTTPIDGNRGEEEGDASAGLMVEPVGVTIEDVPELEPAAKEELCDHFCDEGLDRYKEAFSLLWPDGQGLVHKSKLTQFFQAVLGQLYTEEMGSHLVEIMEPDDDGNITLESFVQAFSLSYWTPESVAAMHEVLASNPDLVNKLADWKNVLSRLGMNMNDNEVANIIEQAQRGAAALLDKELKKSKDQIKDKDEVIKRSTEILDAIKDKMIHLNLGKEEAQAGEKGEGAPVGGVGACEKETTAEHEKLNDEKVVSQIEEHPVELSK